MQIGKKKKSEEIPEPKIAPHFTPKKIETPVRKEKEIAAPIKR